ncbi:MAG: hypothetical protein FD145_884 [Candidatus Saganbacteria bacterium]|uniref:Uncharacterized protein n=1 Tax=Candidatus Saganbacteria bacterium TaxID=2575572 RepID=A0A833L0Z5_UNCSA|nr:MAG: hypothetical protein FD145_884 [Candidatus Saganbacteria bacterium]
MLVGLLFLISPEILGKTGDFCNKTIIVLDEKLSLIKAAIGIILILSGLIILWAILPYASLWYLNIVAAISVFFGLIYLVFPPGINILSSIFDRVLVSTDDFVLGTRKIFGVVLIVFSVYIFYSAYFSSK